MTTDNTKYCDDTSLAEDIFKNEECVVSTLVEHSKSLDLDFLEILERQFWDLI